ncbi:MAG: hypothetical protein J5659_00185 [Clostridia bacterium]|nr:hypothetical protein [Clostridia bacterium]
MMLKVSKNRLCPASGLFRFSISKNAGIIILMTIGMLIFCPGFLLASFQNFTFRPQDYNNPEYLSVFFGVCGVISSVIITIANYISFCYLYKKSSSDVFHALPLTRIRLLLSRAAASFVSVLIPLTVGYLSLWALTAFYPSYALGTFGQIASAYIINILCIITVSAYTLIFIVCAGSAFDLVISFAGFNVAVLAIGSIISSIADRHLTGYSSENINQILKNISVLVYCGSGAVEFALGEKSAPFSLAENSEFIFKTLLFAAIFLAVSVVLYNHRKSERAEQAYAYKFLYAVCSVLAGICGGFLLSRIFILTGDADDISIIGGISFIAGALITTVVYGAVTDRSFKKFRSSLVFGAVSTVIYVIILSIIINGALGFGKKVPELKDIKETYVSFGAENLTVGGNGSKKVIALHKAIIEKNADDDTQKEVETPHTFVNIVYTLNDGDRIARQYFADIEKVQNELFTIYSGEERFKALDNAIECMKGKIYLDFDENEDNKTTTYIVSKEQLVALTQIYKNELLSGDKSVVNGDRNVFRILAYSYSSGEYYDGSNFDISLTNDFPETVAFINTFQVADELG